MFFTKCIHLIIHLSAQLQKFRRDLVFVHSHLPATARSKVLDPFSHFYGGLSESLVEMRYHSASYKFHGIFCMNFWRLGHRLSPSRFHSLLNL